MASGLTEFEKTSDEQSPETRRRRVDRSAAQALPAALAALAVATLVVTTSSSVLVRDGTALSEELGTVSLDDDDDRSRVDLDAIAVGESISECIAVEYNGADRPVSILLSATPTAGLADTLVVVERGTSQGIGDCDLFESDEVVMDGRLSELGAVEVARFADDETVSFRLTFDVETPLDRSVQSAAVDLAWTTSSE